MLFNKNKKPTIQDYFSDNIIENSLMKLKWEHAESETHAWEVIKLQEIQKENKILSMLLSSMGRFRMGEYLYNVTGNRIERSGKSIKIKNKQNPLVRLSKKFTIRIKPREDPKGIVTKIK